MDRRELSKTVKVSDPEMWYGQKTVIVKLFVCPKYQGKTEVRMYIESKEVWLSGDGMDYQRAIQLLKNCMSRIEDSHDESAVTLEDLEYIGFTDAEIEELGWGHLFDLIEEE